MILQLTFLVLCGVVGFIAVPVTVAVLLALRGGNEND